MEVATPPEPVRLDSRYKQVIVFPTATPAEQQVTMQRRDSAWLHIRPNSCLVAAIGNRWKPGAWQKVIDMVKFTNDNGSLAALIEIQDRCFDPYDALGTMRNEAILEAQNGGFEYLLYVDNDVHPNPDALKRLIARDMPIVAPYIAEAGSGKPLHGYPQQPNSGLHPVRWCVLSMLLFKTAVFNCVGPHFWGDAIGADEGYHFKTLWYYGHRPYIDTDVLVITYKAPIYPLTSNHLTDADRERLWQERKRAKIAPPDRRPISLEETRLVDGEYMPFLPAPPQAAMGLTQGG